MDRPPNNSNIEEGLLSAYLTRSGRDLIGQLGLVKPRLLCSLVHKFGHKVVNDFDAFIEELAVQASPTIGELFVFVDECHRTRSGRLHRTMKALMPSAVFIGFTGTPLLKQDKQTSFEVFGGYIHTYKSSEGVGDEEVQISAPTRMSLDTIRLFAISKLGWIKRQQQKLREQERESRREYLDRESHYVWGRRALLKLADGSLHAGLARHARTPQSPPRAA